MTDKSELSDKQLMAIDALLSGKGRAEAAEVAGVDRVTVWRWLNDDAHFMAELNRRRLDVYSTNLERLRGLAGGAIEVLETLLTSENEGVRLRAAVSILKAAHPGDILQPETDPAVIEKDITRRNLFNRML